MLKALFVSALIFRKKVCQILLLGTLCCPIMRSEWRPLRLSGVAFLINWSVQEIMAGHRFQVGSTLLDSRG